SAVAAAVLLPYFGAGEFEFGKPRELKGVIRCEAQTARLIANDADYVLVGPGKHGPSSEICGASNREATIQGTLIRRDGRQLIEVDAPIALHDHVAAEPEPVALGRFTLAGEIVDSKCYFGVMNPGESRVHRACAELCLRGGIPAVFVVRDRTGNSAYLL